MWTISVSLRFVLLGLALGLSGIQPGRAQVRLVEDIRPGRDGSDPTWTTPFDGRLFFWADDGTHGRELWATDGDATTLVADIFPGPEGAQHWPTIPRFLDSLAGKLYFGHRISPTSDERDFKLWATDGDATALVADILPSYYPDPVNNHAVFQGKLYLGAYEPVHGTELWATDSDSTFLVADLLPSGQQPGGSFPIRFITLGDTLYFFANNDEFPSKLWATDGDTVKQVADVRVFWPGPSIVVFEEMLYFQGEGELWRSNGTGAELVADIWPGPTPSRVQDMFVALGRVFFLANDGLHGYELWTTDGETTELVVDLNPGPASGVGFDYTVFDDKLYFFANDGVHGRELWVWDGTSPTLIADICPGCRLAEPTGLTVFDNHLYFAADDGVNGQELWRSDGTGVERVADIQTGPQGSHPDAFTVLGDQLYFAADDGVHGRELWVLTNTPTAVEHDPEHEQTPSFALTPIHPNPFHDRAVFTLTVARRQHVRVALYDVLGRRLALLHDGPLAAETRRSFTFDGENLPSGAYLVRTTGETGTATRLVTVLK